MCGRYASVATTAELRLEFTLDEVIGPDLAPSWNVAPTDPVRVVVQRRSRGGDRDAQVRQLRTMRWGLVPSWSATPARGAKMINARIETVFDKPAFKAAAARRRALIPSLGYFEWRQTDDGKIPYFLHHPDRRLLAFAGLYELWPDPRRSADDPDRWLWTCTIITQPATDLLGHIHDRSPVIVPPQLHDAWLTCAREDAGDARAVLERIPAAALQPDVVSAAVGNVRNNGPELIRPVDVTEVISSTRDPDRPPRRLPATVLTLLVALVVASGLIGYLATRHKPSRATAATNPSPAPPSPPAQPDPVAPAALQCVQPCDTPILRATAGAGPAGLRLLVNTVPLSILDSTGNRTRGPQVPLRRGEHVRSLMRMGVDAVALVQADFVADATPPGRVYRLGPDSVALIGRADELVQGVGATVWTVTYPRSPPSPAGTAPYTLREIDSTGRQLARHTEPPEVRPVRATRAGLLATISPPMADGSYYGTSEQVVLLNPATGRARRVLSNGAFAVLDATDNRVALSYPRRPLIDVYDLDDGTVTGIRYQPAYRAPTYGRFSPDQRSLVLGFSGLPQLGTTPPSYGYLQVLDLDTGAVTPIDGLRTLPKFDAALDWSGNGTLLLAVDAGALEHIALWHGEGRPLTVLPRGVAHSPAYQFSYLQLRG